MPKNKEGDLRVWWIPQISQWPTEAFITPVDNILEAKKLLDTLANYDEFQLKHNIKPDYCNAGGLEIFEEGEWCEWVDEYGCSIDEIEFKDK